MGDMKERLEEAKGPSFASGKSYSEKKRATILSVYSEPIYPRLSLILMICMLSTTAVLTAAELLRDTASSDEGILLNNLSMTGLGIWVLYAVPLLIVSVLGICYNRKKFYARKAESGLNAESEADILRDRRAVNRLNHGYTLYILLALAGIFGWAVFFLLAR